MSDKFTYPKQKLSLKFSLNEAWHNKHGCAKIGKTKRRKYGMIETFIHINKFIDKF